MNAQGRAFYDVRCEGESPTSADLLLYAPIGEHKIWNEFGAHEFADALDALPRTVRRLNVHINSGGGDVFTAQAMHSQLSDFPHEKIVYVDGFAASAATVVAMAGTKVYIRRNASMMIHMPAGLSIGTAEDMRHMAKSLDNITEPIINVYQDKTGLDRKAIRKLMEAETWFTPEEAVEQGFADEVRGKLEAVACVHVVQGKPRELRSGNISFDLTNYHNVSTEFFNRAGIPTTEEQPMREPKITNQNPPVKSPPEREVEPEEPKPKRAPGKEEEPDEEEEVVHEDDPVTDEQITAFMRSWPKITAAISQRAIADERKRLAELDELDHPAVVGVVAAARADGRWAKDIAFECSKLMRNALEGQKRKADASVLDPIRGGDAPRASSQAAGNQVTESFRKASAESAAARKRISAHNRFNGLTN
jgi:ATP-dependent protease ClpP protease subunit